MKLCAACCDELPKESFSKKQWQLKQYQRRCKVCTDANRDIQLKAPPKHDNPIKTDDPLLSDPDLIASLEIFMGMSGSKREEAIHGLMKAVGDDPRKRAEMEDLLKKLPALDEEQQKNSPGGVQSNINQMTKDDELAKAKQDAGKMLADHGEDGTTWEFFWGNQAAILDATIAGGNISAQDAARFKTDEDAWKKQLRIIWKDVTSQ